MSFLSAVMPYALPFGVALALASLLRLAGGAETGARLAGVALPAGFLAAWALFRGLDPAPHSVLDLALHVALGGTLLGLLLDTLRPRRLVSGVAVVAFSVACVWALVAFPLHLSTGRVLARHVLTAVPLLVVWGGVLGCLARSAARETGTAEALVLIAGLAGGLALVGAAAGLAGVTGAAPGGVGVVRPAVGLAVAALGLLAPLVVPGAPRPRLGLAGLLGGGGALLTLAMGLVLTWPVTGLPVTLAGLGLFAGGTARRLPGNDRVASLWTLFLVLVAGALGALLMLALGGR